MDNGDFHNLERISLWNYQFALANCELSEFRSIRSIRYSELSEFRSMGKFAIANFTAERMSRANFAPFVQFALTRERIERMRGERISLSLSGHSELSESEFRSIR